MTTAPAGAPPKARLAAVGALTLVLGFAAGVTYGGARPGIVRVQIEGAVAIDVSCSAQRVQARGDRVALVGASPECEVRGHFGEGRSASGPLDARRPGGYRCREQEGALRCTGS